MPHHDKPIVSLNRSPLARKIILFNLIAVIALVGLVMAINPFRDSLVVERERALAVESQLMADLFEVHVSSAGSADEDALSPAAASEALTRIGLSDGVDVFVFTPERELLISTRSIARSPARPVSGLTPSPDRPLPISSALDAVWGTMARLFGAEFDEASAASKEELLSTMVPPALSGITVLTRGRDQQGPIFAAASPIDGAAGALGVVIVTTAAGEITHLIRSERERLLQVLVVAILVSIALSLILASTIATPLSELAIAAEAGRDKNMRKMAPSQVRIPDMTDRPDEIGRLSGALRGMVDALYARIQSNEQFAADVSHEIKNPLASLRSAVGTLGSAKSDAQRQRLVEVIEHDVRRLDRLVSDISNASRLDSDLVKEQEETFDLTKLLRSLALHHEEEAARQGIEFISDIPKEPILISGLEARLAQVFVNLLANAISFCVEGDAVRLWTRRREDRVLIVVEDTGPGIPEEALTKIFERFYSERPEEQFGDHSGLGLPISKQIVEAHGGVIWAENIRPTAIDVTSQPLGARLVVGLPV